MKHDKTSESRPGRLDPARLASPDLRAMLGVLAAATTIIASTEKALRDEGSGLRGSEWDVLAALFAYGPMRPAEILRRCWMSANAPTVHAILGRLEERNLVRRETHPEQVRGVLVSITTEGIETVERLFPILERKTINVFSGHYTEEELDIIVELAERQ